jgi:hypothetical protein
MADSGHDDISSFSLANRCNFHHPLKACIFAGSCIYAKSRAGASLIFARESLEYNLIIQSLLNLYKVFLVGTYGIFLNGGLAYTLQSNVDGIQVA